MTIGRSIIGIVSTLAATVFLTLPLVAEDASTRGLSLIETTLIDDAVTGYATFQSHNQKVVSNKNGVFLTYVKTRNQEYSAQLWRLLRSTDGGRSFKIVYEATDGTNPPTIETDAAGNLYLVRQAYHLDNNAYFYRFLAANGYALSPVTTLFNGVGGKSAMILDAKRSRVHYFANNNTFHTIDLDGVVKATSQPTRAGVSNNAEYPHLSLDGEGTLYAAWTTNKMGDYLYWDIHAMKSPDGGVSWRKLDETPLTAPVIADQTGPTDRVTLDDEFNVHTWLSNFMVKDGKAHFLYSAQFAANPRQHYVRYDLQTGRKDLDLFPEFQGEQISLAGLDGFFAARASLPDGPLYVVVDEKGTGRLACLASDDNGATWYDYAVSDRKFTEPYAVGGAREITADGYIIGSLTDVIGDFVGQTSSAYFFRIQAGLSRAEVSQLKLKDGTGTVRFAGIRGQPAEIRFRSGDGTWGAWQVFDAEMTAALPSAPTHFQLKSRLGVASKEWPVDPAVVQEDDDVEEPGVPRTITEPASLPKPASTGGCGRF